ncbi:MAG: hypothetical protein QOH90_129 [Actinomycetota bacterium]|nr:hypothetical protein [Actinomycetota bacterium]
MWGTGADPASATGGHLSPEIDVTGPLYDPLTSPLPDESPRAPDGWERVEPQRRPVDGPRPRPDDTEALPPRPVRRPPPERAGVRTARPRGRTALRRVKRTLRHVDPLSVLKVSLIFYACLLVIWLVLVAIFYSFLNSLGLFDQVNDIAKGLVLGKGKFEITLGTVEKWAFLVGIAFAVLGSIANTFLAFLYNVIADAVGGVQMTFVERDV